MSSYYTIAEAAEGFLKIKGSKFYAYSQPVDSEEESFDFLQNIKSLHPKARHHCYAWRIKEPQLIERQNDDGEPSGTAGRPILGQLVKNELLNVAIVVVRYFGGTLLGTSGLIQAYKNSAAVAIENSTTIEIIEQKHFKITLQYSLVHIIEEWAPKLDIHIDHRDSNKTMAIYNMHCDLSQYENALLQLKAKLLNLYEEETPIDKMEFDEFSIEF